MRTIWLERAGLVGFLGYLSGLIGAIIQSTLWQAGKHVNHIWVWLACSGIAVLLSCVIALVWRDRQTEGKKKEALC